MIGINLLFVSLVQVFGVEPAGLAAEIPADLDPLEISKVQGKKRTRLNLMRADASLYLAVKHLLFDGKGYKFGIENNLNCPSLYESSCLMHHYDRSLLATRPFIELVSDLGIIEKERNQILSIVLEWERIPHQARLNKKRFIIDQYYALNKFDEKLNRLDEIFADAKRLAIAVLEEKSQESPDKKMLMDILRARLARVKIVRDYHDKPDFLFNSGLSGTDFFEGLYNIKIGGRLLNETNDEDLWMFLLSHEVSHMFEDVFQGLLPEVRKEILKKADGLKTFNSNTKVDVDEIQGDWLAQEVFLKYVNEKQYSPARFRFGIKKAARFFCDYGGSSFGHPTGLFRINFLQENNKIQNTLCGGGDFSPDTNCR